MVIYGQLKDSKYVKKKRRKEHPLPAKINILGVVPLCTWCSRLTFYLLKWNTGTRYLNLQNLTTHGKLSQVDVVRNVIICIASIGSVLAVIYIVYRYFHFCRNVIYRDQIFMPLSCFSLQFIVSCGPEFFSWYIQGFDWLIDV